MNWQPGMRARVRKTTLCPLYGQEHLQTIAGREVKLVQVLDPLYIILLTGIIPIYTWWLIDVIDGPDSLGIEEPALEPLIGPTAEKYIESLKSPKPDLSEKSLEEAILTILAEENAHK